jgi:hypothetical protein
MLQKMMQHATAFYKNTANPRLCIMVTSPRCGKLYQTTSLPTKEEVLARWQVPPGHKMF